MTFPATERICRDGNPTYPNTEYGVGDASINLQHVYWECRGMILTLFPMGDDYAVSNEDIGSAD